MVVLKTIYGSSRKKRGKMSGNYMCLGGKQAELYETTNGR